MVKPIYNTISKEEAKTQNLQRYYTGVPCKRGHDTERYVSTGHCVRCAYETSRESVARDPHKFKNWYHNNPWYWTHQMLKNAKDRAKSKNLPFDLTLDDIVIPEVCPVFGIPLIASTTGWLHEGSPTLDRIECDRGYVKGNVIVVSWKANKMKNNFKIEDLKTLVEFYSKLND